MSEHLDELIVRLNSAINLLEAMRWKEKTPSEYMRLGGKIEGLKVALGYVEDYEKLVGAKDEK